MEKFIYLLLDISSGAGLYNARIHFGVVDIGQSISFDEGKALCKSIGEKYTSHYIFNT